MVKNCNGGEVFDEIEVLIQSALMKDNKDEYLRMVLKLVKEYKSGVNQW